jgi:predicted TIM-barrel enzyme
MAFTRQQVLQRLHSVIADGRPIIGGGAGTGISAKFEEAGGVDLIIIYNSGRYRMAGRGSLSGLMPYGDANAIVIEMASEVLTIVQNTPILAGVCGTDPFRQMPFFLRQVADTGFSGVQNFPTVGLIDGLFRKNLEETGMGFGLEVDMIRLAHEMDLLTTPYCFNADDAVAMARAGADVVVAHLGLTTKGSIGATTAVTLEDAPRKLQEIADAAKRVSKDVIVLCHGGPISEPVDAEYVLARTEGIHGFYGASSMERLPVEKAIKGTMKEYKAIKLKRR